MALEDFEKSLLNEKRTVKDNHVKERHEKSREHRKHHHHRSHRHHEHHGNEEDTHRHKRRRRSKEDREDSPTYRRSDSNGEPNGSKREGSPEDQEDWVEKGTVVPSQMDVKAGSGGPTDELKRDSWMEAPSALDIEFVQKHTKKVPEPTISRSSKADFELKIHDNELNKHHLQDLADGKDIPDELLHEPAQHEVNYVFGDAGAQWRMTKLKAVYREAKQSGQTVDDVAMERYGDLRAFDDAREEQTELERRETYGEGYVGKEKPSGDLFQERKMTMGVRRENLGSGATGDEAEAPPVKIEMLDPVNPPARTIQLDQTALNRLKAKMMKAKLRGSAESESLESEYNLALSEFSNNKESDIVVLGTMENRMLAGGRKGEVKPIDNKRGRERGLVEENEDMTIEDMVREERRTRGQAGGEGQRFAERIAKDAKFDNDLDYMDENAAKLAKRVQKSEINLKNTAVADFQKLNRILDKCPLCHHEDTNTPPVAPVVSLATRTYLSLPPEPEIVPRGAYIVPIQHRTNLLECDDDEWEEIRNFMKSLTRHYASLHPPLTPLFYENAAHPFSHPHAHLTALPLSMNLHSQAPAFFRAAILSAAQNFSTHKPLIDTLGASKSGMGKWAFRRMIVKQAQYFHVWFAIDGGVGHVVEEGWPGGDRFAREVVGGMVGAGQEVVRGRGRWGGRERERVEKWRKGWAEWDWTKVLLDVES